MKSEITKNNKISSRNNYKQTASFIIQPQINSARIISIFSHFYKFSSLDNSKEEKQKMPNKKSDDLKNSQNCIEEIYSQMSSLLNKSLKEIHSENIAKQAYLYSKTIEHQKNLEEINDDKIKSIELLNDELGTKIIRSQSGCKIRPETYIENTDFNQNSPKSFNIMGISQEIFRKRAKSVPKNQVFSSKRNSLKHNSSTKKLLESSIQATVIKIPEKQKPISKVTVNVRKITPSIPKNTCPGPKVSMFKLVQNPSKNIGLDSDSDFSDDENKENTHNLFKSSFVLKTRQQQYSESKKLVEKYKKLVEQSKSMLNKTNEIIQTSYQKSDENLTNMNTTETDEFK